MAAADVFPFVEPLALLAAAVVAVPVFRQLGLGSVLGYLVAGLAIGPGGFGLVTETDPILHLAEFGVVLLLFLIGLDLHPSRLSSMRRDIFGLGTVQVVATTALLTLVLGLFGLGPRGALVAGAALALSSTAFALQILQERGQAALPFGRRAFAILLLQDLAIVPLLAMVEVLSPGGLEAGRLSVAIKVASIFAALGIVIVAGRFVLNPVFTLLARAEAREIMTAAGLLVVLGAAALMASVGLSMALGAFLAGVLLSESHFRHTLEADLEPFRGLLLGLFFMGIGMTVNIGLVLANLHWVLLLATVVLVVKGAVLYAASRGFGARRPDALRIAALLPQGGEFGFVMLTTAVAGGVLTAVWGAVFNAVIILTMALTPAIVLLFDRLVARLRRRGVRAEVAESFHDARARVLIVGYGRFGAVVAQMFYEEGIDIVALDRSADRIRRAARFGSKVYYGDATRAEVLRAAGAGDARLVALCMSDVEAMRKAIRILRQEFPQAAIFCRATDRVHAIDLIKEGVDYQLRETLESGIAFGRAALETLGIPHERAREIEERVRAKDEERLAIQVAEGIEAGTPSAMAARAAALERVA